MWDDFVRLVQLEQLPKQIQFVILSGQICDAKFQCLHISQWYLRSNKCETTLINLIKLSVCSPLCPLASYWLRMESISLSLPQLDYIYDSASSSGCWRLHCWHISEQRVATWIRKTRVMQKIMLHVACSKQHNNRYVCKNTVLERLFMPYSKHQVAPYGVSGWQTWEGMPGFHLRTKALK